MLGFGRRDVADGPHQAAIVKPVYPFERGELNGLEGTPGSAAVNEFGLVEAIDCFSECIVIGITHAAHGRFDARLGESF